MRRNATPSLELGRFFGSRVEKKIDNSRVSFRVDGVGWLGLVFCWHSSWNLMELVDAMRCGGRTVFGRVRRGRRDAARLLRRVGRRRQVPRRRIGRAVRRRPASRRVAALPPAHRQLHRRLVHRTLDSGAALEIHGNINRQIISQMISP